ncbi:pyridoxamine 5'-phosphate oxidase family protein [Marinicellulosiphila megalodicopiae]|uniref:pyridoxamine 5'-phosphate oxidase family protein n=1 Tax=Marinicellulosiphila megalodicopiae TaxID=2724896 RepID=UPI003BB1CD1B
MFFENQLKAQNKYQDKTLPPKVILEKMITQYLNHTQIQFIEEFHFCFIATSNMQGDCDCSFRGSDCDENTGNLLPLLEVIDQKTLLMPDFSGNGLLDSVGNLIDNPNIGLLFIHPDKAQRLRVNGSVKIILPSDEHLNTWPKAKRILLIKINRVFFNCHQRIKSSISNMNTLGKK